jgi:hypothetical protein
MDGAGNHQAIGAGADIAGKLRSSLSRFPRGLNLGREDLAVIGWLYFFEQETSSHGISDTRLKWLIAEALRQLGFDGQAIQSAQLIQRLMRLSILRMTIAEGTRRGYRLTCFGQNLARHYVEETDYSSEQLNLLLACALGEIESAVGVSEESLFKSLKHVFLGAIREKIEYKLLAIEDDLEERKSAVKRTFTGTSQEELESAIKDIEYCRMALTELVDAVRESSACVSLEEILHRHLDRRPDAELSDVLEQSLDFLYILRGRVDTMLKGVVEFIRDCVAYRSLALTVDSRDRLCRVQERILAHALHHDLRMPILGTLRLPRMDLNWSRIERERPFLLDMNKLRTIENYLPSHLPPVEPDWKNDLLDLARSRWSVYAGTGGVDLGEWLGELADSIPLLSGALWQGLWLLSQDWPNWTPPVSVVYETGNWVPLGDEWLMEAIRLVPAQSYELPLEHKAV